MSNLGSFGTPREAYTDEFDYFGETLRVHPDLSDLALIEFARMGSQIDEKTTGDQAISAVFTMLQMLVHVDDFETFWSAAKANRQTIDDLTDLAGQLVEAVAKRPTKRPSTSSRGRQRTAQKSAVASSRKVVRRLERQGRPDLALLVERSSEAISA